MLLSVFRMRFVSATPRDKTTPPSHADVLLGGSFYTVTSKFTIIPSGRFSAQECQLMRDIAKNRNASTRKVWTSTMKYKLKGAGTFETSSPGRGSSLQPGCSEPPTHAHSGNYGGRHLPAVDAPREPAHNAKLRSELEKVASKIAEYELHRREDQRALEGLFQKAQDQNGAVKQGIAEVVAAAELQLSHVAGQLAPASAIPVDMLADAFDAQRVVSTSDYVDQMPINRQHHHDDLLHLAPAVSADADAAQLRAPASTDSALNNMQWPCVHQKVPHPGQQPLHAIIAAAHCVNSKRGAAAAARANSASLKPVNDPVDQMPTSLPDIDDDLLFDGLRFSMLDGSLDMNSDCIMKDSFECDSMEDLITTAMCFGGCDGGDTFDGFDDGSASDDDLDVFAPGDSDNGDLSTSLGLISDKYN
ncbi:unnamed protein product, partial [Prorocentrum cordatum]